MSADKTNPPQVDDDSDSRQAHDKEADKNSEKQEKYYGMPWYIDAHGNRRGAGCPGFGNWSH